jgi:uncharacterized protein involved in exopolysaccharide biosynthesis
LNRLEVQLKGVQDSLLNAEQQRMLLESSRSSAISSLATFRELASQPGGASRAGLGAKRPPTDLERARGVLNALLLKYSDDHPDVARQRGLVERLEALETQAQAALQAEAAAAEPEQPEEASQAQSLPIANMLKEHEDRIKNIDIQLSILDGNTASHEREKNQILAEMGATQRRVEALPKTEQQLAMVVRDYDISRENYRRLLDKKNAADLASDLETVEKGERLVVLDQPRVPSKPIKPQREMLIGMGCAGGLAVGMLLGFGLELRRGVMLGEWELPEGSTVLGRVPPVRLAVAKRNHGFTPTESKRAPWPKARITLRLASPRVRMVLAPTILFCLLGALVATSIYAGWSPF